MTPIIVSIFMISSLEKPDGTKIQEMGFHYNGDRLAATLENPCWHEKHQKSENLITPITAPS